MFRPGEFVKPLSILSCIDDYNKFIGGIDIADQYRSYYTTQLIAQQNWLLIFFWILDTALLNSFIFYREFFNSKVENSCPFSHKEFNIEVTWSWILQGENSVCNKTDKLSAITSILSNAAKVTYMKDSTSLPSVESHSEGKHLPVAGKRVHCF